MKEGFLRSDTPQSEKLRVEVTSCLFLLLLDLFQTFLRCPGGKRKKGTSYPFESCAFFSSTLSFLALVLAFLILPFCLRCYGLFLQIILAICGLYYSFAFITLWTITLFNFIPASSILFFFTTQFPHPCLPLSVLMIFGLLLSDLIFLLPSISLYLCLSLSLSLTRCLFFTLSFTGQNFFLEVFVFLSSFFLITLLLCLFPPDVFIFFHHLWVLWFVRIFHLSS